MKKSLKGFTLVEMLIVISIIAILSGAILAGMGSSRAKARNAKMVSDMNNLSIIAENNYSAGNYPKLTDLKDGTIIGASDAAKANIILQNTKITYCPSAGSYRIQGVLEAGKDTDELLNSSLTGTIGSCTCSKTATPPQFCIGE